MADKSPLLRLLGIAAGGLGCFEALVWGIMSLLAVLTYSDVFDDPTFTPVDDVKLAFYYYLNKNQYWYIPEVQLFKFSAEDVLIFTSLYLATSIIWFTSSVLLLLDFLNSKFTSYSLIVWVVVTGFVSALDLAATISFGVEFDNFKQISAPTNFLMVPVILMVLSARGFILWIMNTALAIYLGVAVSKLKKTPTVTEVSPGNPRRLSLGSLYSSKATDSYDRGRQNPTFQPEPLSAWNIQSPTVGEMRRSPWSFPENVSPLATNDNMNSGRMFPRVGRPVSTPVAPVMPLPIPQPDYSPPLGRPVKHEPNLYDSPLRSALKKPHPMGRTLF